MIENPRENEYASVDGIVAKCKDCKKWASPKGKVYYEIQSECVNVGGIIEDCRDHHLQTRHHGPLACNQFGLWQDNTERGYATVSSATNAGYIYLDEETKSALSSV